MEEFFVQTPYQHYYIKADYFSADGDEADFYINEKNVEGNDTLMATFKGYICVIQRSNYVKHTDAK